MPKCTILIGVPGSGKSTWLESLGKFEDTTTIISTDNTIEYIAEEFGMTYDQCFKDLIKFAEKVMWNSIESAVHFEDNIIIDRTNLSAASRRKFFRSLEDYEFEAVVFATPEQEEWDRRLNSRPGKTIPSHVLNSMATSMELPSESEGFSKITYV